MSTVAAAGKPASDLASAKGAALIQAFVTAIKSIDLDAINALHSQVDWASFTVQHNPIQLAIETDHAFRRNRVPKVGALLAQLCLAHGASRFLITPYTNKTGVHHPLTHYIADNDPVSVLVCLQNGADLTRPMPSFFGARTALDQAILHSAFQCEQVIRSFTAQLAANDALKDINTHAPI